MGLLPNFPYGRMSRSKAVSISFQKVQVWTGSKSRRATASEPQKGFRRISRWSP